MKKKKKIIWYKDPAFLLVSIICFPIVVIAMLLMGATFLISFPKRFREYKKSRYYLDQSIKYSPFKYFSAQYTFYNSAIDRGLEFEYFIQKSNKLEYFIYDGILYLFPDFSQLFFDEEANEWKVKKGNTSESFFESFKALVDMLESSPSMPVKLFLDRSIIAVDDISRADIPECIYVNLDYKKPFENEDSPFNMVVPRSSEELFEMIENTPNLCGLFEHNENTEIVYWKPFVDNTAKFTDICNRIVISIDFDYEECLITVSKQLFKGKSDLPITHLDTTEYEIYDKVCNIGKRGNVLVIRKLLFYDKILYIGPKKDCPYSEDKKYLFGEYYFLEAKQTLSELVGKE